VLHVANFAKPQTVSRDFMENIQYEIRLANDNDFEDIFRIYSQYFDNIFPAYDLVDKTKIYKELKEYFDERFGIFNYWVMTKESEVIGWHSLSKISNNPIKMKWRAESSIYINQNHLKFGLGEILMNFVFDIAKKDKDLYLIIGWLPINNVANLKLTSKVGFKILGQISKSITKNLCYGW
jgi:L-amino acid N-acyltransferase YncA